MPEPVLLIPPLPEIMCPSAVIVDADQTAKHWAHRLSVRLAAWPTEALEWP